MKGNQNAEATLSIHLDYIAWLDCDYMASWGALVSGRRETIDFHDDDLPKLAFEMDDTEDKFSVYYTWPDRVGGLPQPIRSTVRLDHRPCRFGGTRPYFVAPCCARRTLRLAVLEAGLYCRECGSVTWGSRREHKLDRLIRKGNKIAARLDCEAWHAEPTSRPKHMRREIYAALQAKRSEIAEQIYQRMADRLSRRHRDVFEMMTEVSRFLGR